MSKLILLRHGESIWNKKNVFTGWVDLPLSDKGIQEAINAGHAIQHEPIDTIFCSTLIRGIMTGMIAMAYHKGGKTPVIMHEKGKLKEWSGIFSEKEKSHCIPVFCADELNERMYGKLQGLNKRETMDQFGEDQVKIWRRSYKTCPPDGESLEMTTKRTIPYFKKKIEPLLFEGNNILISAHGNSLRAIVKYLDNLSDDEVVALEIATGVPLFYETAGKSFRKIGSKHKE